LAHARTRIRDAVAVAVAVAVVQHSQRAIWHNDLREP
jgi:hypothetical protein